MTRFSVGASNFRVKANGWAASRSVLIGALYLGVCSSPIHAQVRFDAWSRCTDGSLPAEKRIEYCSEVLHWGGGPSSEISALIMLASIHRDRHEYDQALALYDRAVAYESLGTSRHDASMPSPGILVTALAGRAEIRALTGQRDLSLADSTEIFKLMPDSAAAFLVRCRVRAVMKSELEKAAADCAEALQRAPHNTEVFAASAYLRYRQGDLKQAQDDCDAALALNGRSSGALYLRGVIRLKQGDAAGGSEDIAAAKERNPTIAASFADIGVSP